MTRKTQAVLEAQAKALHAEVRSLKRQLRVATQARADAESIAVQADATIGALREEIARQASMLVEKGVVPLPDHALRALSEKLEGQPGVRKDRFTRIGV